MKSPFISGCDYNSAAEYSLHKMVHLIASEKTALLGKCVLSRKDLIEHSNLIGIRHFQVLLLFFGISFGYFLRVNISAAIVPMTQSTAGQPYYEWDSSTKSLILSSFFWGYVVAQMPVSLLAKRFGGKIVLGLSTAISSIITLFHPLAVNGGNWRALVALRVFVGLTQGAVYPCMHTLLAKWVPRNERGFLSAAAYSGAQFGTALILAVSGTIFNSSMGWPGLYYITGAVTLLWAVVFLILGADTPRDTRFISEAEKKYVEALTGSSHQSEWPRASLQEMVIPWKALFTSLPFYGLLAAHCGFTWGFYTLLTEMPTYMSNILELNVNANALLSALPYLAMWLLSLVISPIADTLINRNITSVTVSRKLFNSIGQWIPMACLIAVGYMTKDDKALATTLLTIGVGLNAASFCGYLVNHMDLSPNFAGLMMGITNCVSNLMSVFAPLVVGAIVVQEENPEQWRVVFFITAGVYLVCNSLFLIFGAATVQPWNSLPNSSSATSAAANAARSSITSIPSDATEQKF